MNTRVKKIKLLEEIFVRLLLDESDDVVSLGNSTTLMRIDTVRTKNPKIYLAVSKIINVIRSKYITSEIVMFCNLIFILWKLFLF